MESMVQHQQMPVWLLHAAIQGNKQLFEQVFGSENAIKLTIETSETAPSCSSYLHSSTFMGNTVLHELATYGHDEIASMICQKDGFMWKKKNNMLETPFHRAAKAGHDKTISALIEFARGSEDELKEVLKERNRWGETALHEATRRGYEAVVSEIMRVNPILACEHNNDGLSPLSLAAARGTPDDISMVQKMLEQLPNQNIDSPCPDRPNQQPPRHSVHKSVGTNKKSATHASTSVGKNDAISKSMPIHFLASHAESIAMVKFLLEKDASLAYLQDSSGMFPIHEAASSGNVEIIVLLIQMHPDSGELLDHQGKNLFHFAAEENMSGVFHKLLAKSENNPLRDMDKMFVRLINETDCDGNTPLHLAAKMGYKSVMKSLFVNEHINLNLRNREGLTPFNIAVIQVKESTNSSQDMQLRIEQYTQENGTKFTLAWFNQFMRTSEGKRSQMIMDELQIIGLGAVLITTVTFSAAFTLPGGYDSNGWPVLGRRYMFKAFLLADASAFIQPFFCLVTLIYGGLSSLDRYTRDAFLSIPLDLFASSAKSMVLAFGLGLYLLLSSVSHAFGIFILVYVIGSLMVDEIPKLPFGMPVFNKTGKFRKERQEEQGVSESFLGSILAPSLFIFLCALIP